jgi:hypothetical protein
VGVFASFETRLERARQRFSSQGRLEIDELDWNGFIRTDLLEAGIKPDAQGQMYDTEKIMKTADFIVVNNSGRDELRKVVVFALEHSVFS